MRVALKFSTVFIILTIFSCKPIDPEKIDWKPEVLGPVLKSNLEIYDFEELIFSNTAYEVEAGNLQIPGYAPNIPLPIVPPINGISLPSEYLRLSEFFNLVVIDSADIDINFNNVFPIPIEKGTKLTIKDSITKELIAEHLITRDVAPNENYEFDFLIFNKSVSQTLEIQIEEFYSPGGQNVTFDNETLIVNVEIEFVNIDWVEILNDVSYSDTSTTEIDFNSDGSTDPFNGTLSLFLENNFPCDFRLQMDLYDDNDNFIYSFFGDEGVLVERGIVDPGGNVIENTKFELLDFIHTDDIPLIENATKLQVKANFLTRETPNINIVDETSYIELIITTNTEITVQEL